jgi:hypothetical protein
MAKAGLFRCKDLVVDIGFRVAIRWRVAVCDVAREKMSNVAVSTARNAPERP